MEISHGPDCLIISCENLKSVIKVMKKVHLNSTVSVLNVAVLHI